jgi:hypothetical protein
MTTPLDTRERCLQLLQRHTYRDSFLASYALLLAVEALDLDQLNGLVDSVVDAASNPSPSGYNRAVKLAAERWHPSRLD